MGAEEITQVDQVAEVLAAHQRMLDGPGSCWCGAWPPAENDVPWTNHLAAALIAAGLVVEGTGEWRPGDGDSRCQNCGHEYQPWFTDNALWNEVVGGPGFTEDPGGYLCPTCFASRAERSMPGFVWRFIPNWSRPAYPDRVTEWVAMDEGGE